MKRPPQIPELPAPPRRRRGLSEEERALWESVAKQTKPLRRRARAARAHVVSPDPATPAVAKPASPLKQLPPAKIPRVARPALPPAAPPLAPLGRRERSQLSRGRKEIDARLDLHGMTQTRAHRVLFGFLQRASVMPGVCQRSAGPFSNAALNPGVLTGTSIWVREGD